MCQLGDEQMVYILLGCLAFLIAFFFDLVALKGISHLKQAVGLVFVLLFGFALSMVCLKGDRFHLPYWLSWAGWPLLALSSGLLIYSIFLEIPFKQTYATTGVGDKLVKTGTYALTRHPGVLWFGLSLLALLAISRSVLLLTAALPWFFLDVAWVWIQERFFFSRMFPGYEQYKRETPMLIPTRESTVRCVRTLWEGRAAPANAPTITKHHKFVKELEKE
jgi:protein-S-isoprenylcysteine O-methyltransferase Ste14